MIQPTSPRKLTKSSCLPPKAFVFSPPKGNTKNATSYAAGSLSVYIPSLQVASGLGYDKFYGA